MKARRETERAFAFWGGRVPTPSFRRKSASEFGLVRVVGGFWPILRYRGTVLRSWATGAGYGMQTVLTAMLPLLGVLVGAGLQYAFGRALDGRRQLEASKALAYSDYLRAFATIAASGRSKEALAQLTDAKMRVCVYGSETVIRLLGDFERGGALARNNMRLVSELVVAMREDVSAVAGKPAQEDLGLILFGPDWHEHGDGKART
jgi:hypothetical protein